ncbi:hypothetical protein DEJ48_38830 [Streptomyces venezuelae]|uniref:Uncharacterized protein n=1 Tax=Streptomyces venezuelae TaxID=54571 RepID=A0A5P2C723_STRVZ|nr:hypothetical protein DEJ48_38830 [Streptomyces venezuelae]
MDDPTEEALGDLLSEMNLAHRFVILERLDLEPADQHYIHVYLNDDRSYQIEYREGSADQHYQAHIPRLHEVFGPEATIAKTMMDWAHNRTEWRKALPWTPMSPQ